MNIKNIQCKLVLATLLMGSAGYSNTFAQEASQQPASSASGSLTLSSASLGLSSGIGWSTLKYSDLNDDIYPTVEGIFRPQVGLFLQLDMGANSHWSFRPKLGFASYGVKLPDIVSPTIATNQDEVSYQLDAHAVNIDVALLYRFSSESSPVRPYIGVQPSVGIVRSGNITYRYDYLDESFQGLDIPLSTANFAQYVWSLHPIIGLQTNLRHRGSTHADAIVGIEASLGLGLSNTYSRDEQRGRAIDALTSSYVEVDDTRRHFGANVSVYIAVPLMHASSSSPSAPKPAPAVVTYEPKPEAQPVVIDPTPCYTLEEVQQMMARGENVGGHVICAIEGYINFNFGESTIKSSSFDYLDQLAETLKRTGSHIIIKGHTDNVGSEETNMSLSRRRAFAVKNYLVAKGMKKNMITTEGYGSTRPLKSNDTEEGRACNRRVEFEIVNQ